MTIDLSHPDARSAEFDRTPPQNIEAEKSVLGGMLLSKDAIADVIEVMRAGDFYRPAHQLIYEAAVDLYGRGEPVDQITVAAELTRQGQMTRAGGPTYLLELAEFVPTAASAGYYARIVAEQAILRRLVEAGTRIVQLGFAGRGGDVDDIVDRAQQAIFDVTERRTSEDYIRLEDLLNPTLEEIEAIGNRGGEMSGVPTGFADLDALTHGMHPGQLIMIAARPAIGKCISGETKLVDARSGERMTIAEFVARGQRGEPLMVHTIDDRWCFTAVCPDDFIDNGVQPVLRLTLRSGRTLRATATHPLRTVAGWVPLAELRPGDHIAVARSCGPLQGRPFPDCLRDVIPAEVWDLVAKVKGDELTWDELDTRCGWTPAHGLRSAKDAPVTRRVLERLARALRSPELADLAESDVLWDEVLGVDPDGESRVYDLTVEGTHNFVANDIVVHNSTLGLDLARSAAIKHNKPAVIFSLEMSKHEITMRLLSAEARVHLQHMRTGRMSEDEWGRLARRMGEVAHAPLFIDDSPNLTMMEIRAKARRLRQRHDLQLVVVDYLQLMTSPKRVENRQQEVSDISRSMKLLAKELEVPVVAISQLNRSPEQRSDKKPQLSDLRESGCLTGDTRVLRADTGAEVPIEELCRSGERNIPVWTLDDDLKLVRGTMTHAFSSGTKEVFEMRLASGRTVKASANHPFLTYDGWRRLDELGEGSRIAVPRRVSAPSSTQPWPDAEIVMLAHLLGDGCFASKQPLHYTSADEANLRAVEEAAAHWGVTPRRVPQETWSHVYLPAPYHLTHGVRNPIVAWLDGFGLYGLRSHQKFLPEGVFGLPNEQVAMFLRHLWATDGSVGYYGQPRIYYASSSRRLVDDVARLLLRLDIRGRISVVQKADCRPGYHLHITGAEQQRRFLKVVGVHGRRGEIAAELLTRISDLKANTNVDTIPSEVWASVRARLAESPLTVRQFQSDLGTQLCGSTLYKSAPSRDRLGRVATILSDQRLVLLAESDVLWDKVVAIEACGAQPVFDATVPVTNNFVADGVVAHNSLEQDSDVVILLYREDAFERESPRAGEADFIVAKHRNGPTGVITVAFQGHYSRFVDMSPGT